MKRPSEAKQSLAAAIGIAAFAVAMTTQATRAASCIIKGDPVAAATADTSSCATDGDALVTGTLMASVASPTDFDIRDWTLLGTLGIKLNTWPWRGGLFIIR